MDVSPPPPRRGAKLFAGLSVLAGLLACIGTGAVATPAGAATCGSYFTHDSANAELFAMTSACTQVRLRHQYQPTATGLTYWTSWDVDASHAHTGPARIYVQSDQRTYTS